MLLLAVFLAATPPSDARVSLVVVHDGTAPHSIEVARAAAKYLYANATHAAQIATSIQEVPLSSTCARAAGCDERPDADVLLLVTASTSTSVKGGAHLEVLDARGAVTAQDDIAVDDVALLNAVLAPSLDRMIATAKPVKRSSASTAADTTSGAGSSTGEESSLVPWLLGGLGTCAGVCALSTITACIYGISTDGGAGNDGVDAGGCDIDLGLGDALGGACDGLGDGLGAGADACGSIGNIGSCAVPVSSPLGITFAAAPTNTTLPPDDGAMAY